MKIIEKLSNMIEKEMDCAEKYIVCALEYKEERPTLADTFYRISNEKMAHMSLLHAQVAAIIDEYRKKNGEPPESMQTIYNILHKKHIEHAAAIKGMLAYYKENIK